MRLQHLVLIPAMGLIVGLLALMGCASSEPVRFYVLNAQTTPATPTPTGNRDVAIGIGPITLPEHLDRPQIVTRTSSNELNLADFHQWAGPLQDNVTQVLAENLSAMIPTRQIHIYPWRRATAIDYQITAEVTRFDRQESGDSVLNIRWRLLDEASQTERLTRTSTFRAQPNGDDYAATVAAMNETLSTFSQEVAEAIQTLR